MSKFKRRDFIKAAAVSSIAPLPRLNLLNALGYERTRTLNGAARAALFPQADTFAPGVIQRILSGPSLSLSFDEREHPEGAIRPGQPLHLEWEVYDWRITGATGGPSPDSRYRSAGASLTYNGNPIWSGTDRRPIIPPDRIPRGFYRLNQFNQMRLEVRESQASTNYISGRGMVEVVADGYPTWEWTVADLVYHWKDTSPAGRNRRAAG